MKLTDKSYTSVQEMLDDVDKETADKFRENQAKWSTRFFKFWTIKTLCLKIWLVRSLSFNREVKSNNCD